MRGAADHGGPPFLQRSIQVNGSSLGQPKRIVALVYNACMRPSPRSGFILAVVAALVGVPARAAETGKTVASTGIEYVMPAAGAVIPSGPVVVAGRIPAEAASVSLLLDGTPVTGLSREGATFSATLAPATGPHTLEARAGGLGASLTFTYGAGGQGLPPYRYHTPVLERRCAECHAGVRRAAATAEADTCKSCHRKLATIYPYVHGPLAAGKCLVCHEPHGSNWPSLTLADARTMCTRCHDQPESLAHVEKARSRVCYLCHNPHSSMNRKFLYNIVK
jgi:predicted CXXCH cytochrome family protein